MQVGRLVQQSYDRLPYPAVKRAKRFSTIWRIAPMGWIEAMWRRPAGLPRRILVAGCGTGNEAFALHRSFPKASIVGIDFSTRSIAIARGLQKRFFPKVDLRFFQADITNRNLDKVTGSKFDFISCHGVLSYLEEPGRAIAALTRCLSERGAIYLGVNGSRHNSETWRRGLTDFGYDPEKFVDDPRLRRTLRLFDVLTGSRPGSVANMGAEYLSSDLFGPVINNWSLPKWSGICARCGLHMRGSYSAHNALRQAINHDLYGALIPRSLAEAHALVEKIAPAGFHLLVFTREPEPRIPWAKSSLLRKYAVVRTNLFRVQWPARKNANRSLRPLVFESASTNTRLDLNIPGWLVEAMRSSDPDRSLDSLLKESRTNVSPNTVKDYLYLLYLLAVIDLVPPLKQTAR